MNRSHLELNVTHRVHEQNYSTRLSVRHSEVHLLGHILTILLRETSLSRSYTNVHSVEDQRANQCRVLLYSAL